MAFFIVEKPVWETVLKFGITWACTHVVIAMAGVGTIFVDKRTQVLPALMHQFCTVCAQALSI